MYISSWFERAPGRLIDNTLDLLGAYSRPVALSKRSRAKNGSILVISDDMHMALFRVRDGIISARVTKLWRAFMRITISMTSAEITPSRTKKECHMHFLAPYILKPTFNGFIPSDIGNIVTNYFLIA